MQQFNPPKWADKLLTRFCRAELAEIIQGDLYEIHQKRVVSEGKLRANFHYFRDVLSLYRPFAIKKRSNSNKIAMLKNFILVSFRNLKRNFSYSSINILGLAIGLASVIVIGSWVYQEYSYEKGFNDSEKVFRVGVNFFNIGDMAIGPEKLKESLDAFPEIKAVTSYNNTGDETVLIDNREYTLSKTAYADKEFFKIFSYEFLQGDPSSALSSPYSIVLTEDEALKLFGSSNALNKTLILKSDNKSYTVSGVIRKPGLTHLPSSAFIANEPDLAKSSWTSVSGYVYLKIDALNPSFRLNQILDAQVEERRKQFAPDMSEEEFRESGLYKFLPMPIEDIHLKSTLKFEPSLVGNKQTTDLFAGIALLILLLASINFINITTARATTRAKEVGVRKSLGTHRSNLFFQFTFESILLSVIAVIISLLLAELFLYSFETITGLELLPSLYWHPLQIPIILLFAVVLGFFSGIYPAMYMTRFDPVTVLKGIVDVKEKNFTRNSLVVFQFVISISLIIVSLVIYNQIQFMQDKDLGLNKENVLIVRNIANTGEHSTFIKQQLSTKPYVIKSSLNGRVPASGNLSVTTLKNNDEEDVWLQRFEGDENMIECMGYQLFAGRNFQKDLITDTASFILNESAMKAFNLSDKDLGKTFNNGSLKLIGFVRDFNFTSLKEKIEPAMLTFAVKDHTTLAIKYEANSSQYLVKDLIDLWSSQNIEGLPNYVFLDDSFDKFVNTERVLSKAILIFTILAMFISCLGLYGLSIFTTNKRAKEISIRRVLGASWTNIVKTLALSFTKPLIIAFLIAIPLSFYLTTIWLDDYAYRISIGVIPFLIAGSTSILTGLFTILRQSMLSATRNPASSLRKE